MLQLHVLPEAPVLREALAVVDDPAVALALLFLCLGLVGGGAR